MIAGCIALHTEIIMAEKNIHNMEIWKKISHNELYEISNIGNCRRLGSYIKANKSGGVRFAEGHNKKLTLMTIGYYMVSLWINGVEEKHYVHSLVANEFLDKVGGKTYVNHKNGIKTDNSVENLEWCTQKENVVHARDSLKVDFNPNGRKKIVCLNTGEIFESIAKAAKILGLNKSHVANVCRGIATHHKKYKFMYA